MATIKTELKNLGIQMFGENFLDITKKRNTYTVNILADWDYEIVRDIKQGRLNSWGAEEQSHVDRQNEIYALFDEFSKQASIINPEFSNGFDDSDRGFVPNEYLFVNYKHNS